MAEVYVTAGIEAAKITGDSAEMTSIIVPIAARARANAARRGDTAFASSISIETVRGRSGVRDRLIVASDPLAAPKELGHVIRNEADGPVLGYVRGLRYMGSALSDTREVR